jgi:hypothetical protein
LNYEFQSKPLPSSPPSTKPGTVSRKASIFINLSVAPFYVMPPDKAAAIKMLLYLLTAGWCKVGYSTPMNVNVSKTPPFAKPQNVIGQHNKKGFIEINFVGIIDLKANFKYPYINNTIC